MTTGQLISRSAPSFARWRPRTRCGARRGFTANCGRSASTSRRAQVSRLLEPHTAPVGADVEDVFHQSPRVRRVDGFLHRTDPHGSRAVRGDRAIACPSPHRAFQHHAASNIRLDRPISRRGIPGRQRAQVVASRSRQRLQRDVPASRGGHGHRRSGLSAGESVAESVRRACNRLNSSRFYSRYYHRTRTHLGLAKDAPDPRPSRARPLDQSSRFRKSTGRVEEKRGNVQARRRQERAAPFVAALAEKTIAPFLLPAHRTGRDHLGHPALGRVSRQGVCRDARGHEARGRTPSFPNATGSGNSRYPRPATLCRLRRKRRTAWYKCRWTARRAFVHEP
jgi:hypothetical protein